MSTRFVAPLPEERKAKLSGSANVTPEQTLAASIPALPPQHPARGSPSAPSGPDARMPSRPSSPSPSVSSSWNFDKDGDNSNLTDEELRKLYDDEEVEWFLRLFSKHVTEVHLPPSEPSSAPKRKSPERKVTLLGSELSEVLANPTSVDGELDVRKVPEDEWVGLGKSKLATSEEHEQRNFNPAAIVASVIGPLLPPAPVKTSSPFTLASLRLAFQRMYMVCYPTYVPLAEKLWRLSTWQNPSISLAYCTLYFLLWWHDVLLPCLLLGILFSLFMRRFTPHPTVEELRNRRKRLAELETLGTVFDSIDLCILATIHEGSSLTDTWKALRNASKLRKERIRQKVDQKLSSSLQEGEDGIASKDVEQLRKEALKDAKMEEKERRAEENWKTIYVVILESIADLHERVKNIFIWRKPEVSWKYCMILGVAFFISLLPARILAKIIYLVLGFVFWFVVPVICELTPEERGRLPPPLNDSMTDAEVATAIIVERTARGERVLPARKHKLKEGDLAATLLNGFSSTGVAVLTSSAGSIIVAETPSVTGQIDPMTHSTSERLKSFVSGSLELVDHGAKIIKGERKLKETHNVLSSLRNHHSTSQPILQPVTMYPAERHGKVGNITLSSTKLEFVSVGSSKPLTVELSQVCGVKKSGILGGLVIEYHTEVNTPEEKGLAEVKFGWVNGRDELFAKLVGWRSHI